VKPDISLRRQLTGYFILIAIACLSLTLRISPLARTNLSWAFDQDSIGYVRLADGLKSGCGFAPRLAAGGCGPAEVERTPGYPFFLSLFHDTRSVLVVQAVLGTAVCFLVALFAWRQWGFAAGVLAELITALDLSSIINNSVGTEILFTFFATLAILLLLKMISVRAAGMPAIIGALSVGCLLGLAQLVRPIAQVLLIVVPLAMVAMPVPWPRRLAWSALALILPAAAIGGWSYRNLSQRGVWTFSSIGAVNLYYYRAAGVLARESGHSVYEVQSDLLRAEGRETEAPDLWSKTADENPAEMERRGLRIIMSHPWTFTVMSIRALTRNSVMPPNRPAVSAFFGHEADQREANSFLTKDVFSSLKSTLDSPWLLGIRALLAFQSAVTLFMWTGVALAIYRLRDRTSPDVWLIAIPLCASLLLLGAAAGPEMNDRFRVPVVPMLALVAAFGWTAKPRRKATPV